MPGGTGGSAQRAHRVLALAVVPTTGDMAIPITSTTHAFLGRVWRLDYNGDTMEWTRSRRQRSLAAPSPQIRMHNPHWIGPMGAIAACAYDE